MSHGDKVLYDLDGLGEGVCEEIEGILKKRRKSLESREEQASPLEKEFSWSYREGNEDEIRVVDIGNENLIC